MNNIQITTHDKRAGDLADDIANLGKGPNTLFVAYRIGSPKAVMINNRKAVFKLGNLKV